MDPPSFLSHLHNEAESLGEAGETNALFSVRGMGQEQATWTRDKGQQLLKSSFLSSANVS